jgi:GDP-L-fucose synthase
LAELVRAIVGYQGEVAFGHSKPDDTPRKLLDCSRLRKHGWTPGIALPDGIARTNAGIGPS